MPTSIKTSFQSTIVSVAVKCLLPSRTLDPRERKHSKYKQIESSIRTIGVVEPLVVHPDGHGKFRVLDGHKRLDILRNRRAERVDCLISNDDEAYTYNRRANYLSTVAEHHMILRALQHNSEARIAEALNVDVATIREKCSVLNGICKEAVEILKDKRVNPRTFAVLKKMKPIRQIEAARFMVASNMYSGRFAEALLSGTREDLLNGPIRPKKSLSSAQKERIEHETESLLEDLKSTEESYGVDALTLSVSCRYVGRWIANSKVRRHLAKGHPEILEELESLVVSVLNGEPENASARSDTK